MMPSRRIIDSNRSQGFPLRLAGVMFMADCMTLPPEGRSPRGGM